MSNSFIFIYNKCPLLNSLSKSENTEPNFVLRLYELNITMQFMETKTTNPNCIQNQLAKKLGCSDSTIKR